MKFKRITAETFAFQKEHKIGQIRKKKEVKKPVALTVEEIQDLIFSDPDVLLLIARGDMAGFDAVGSFIKNKYSGFCDFSHRYYTIYKDEFGKIQKMMD